MNASVKPTSIIVECDWKSDNCMMTISIVAGMTKDTLAVPYQPFSLRDLLGNSK